MTRNTKIVSNQRYQAYQLYLRYHSSMTPW